MRNSAIREMFREFWPYVKKDRLRLLGGGLLGLVVLGAELASVAIFEAMTSHVLQTRHLAGFRSWPGPLLRLPAGYADERRTGDLLVRLIDDVAVVERAVASGPVSLITSVTGIAGFAVATLVIRWDLALARGRSPADG